MELNGNLSKAVIKFNNKLADLSCELIFGVSCEKLVKSIIEEAIKDKKEK